MALFFFVIGMEVKREIAEGTLSDLKRAALPIAAALGGMVVPATIYVAILFGQPAMRGWGIPMATDIAFVVGCLAVLGSRVPQNLRILLLSLAIVDDIGAILVISIAAWFPPSIRASMTRLPLNFIFGLVVATYVRPMTPKHFFNSFIVPVIPLCFAWDGAVSNARTYTEFDLRVLLSSIEADDYQWTIGRVDAKPAKHLYLLGTAHPS